MSKRSDYSSQLGGAALLSCAAVLLVTALPLTAAAQSCVPPRDPVLIAATQALREGRKADADKIIWDAVQATEQSAPDSPNMALYLRRSAGMHGTDPVAALQRAREIDTRAFGPQSCVVAQDLYTLAFVYQEKQPAEAQRILKQVIDLLDDSPADLSLKASAFSQLALLYIKEKRVGEATAMYELAVKDCDLAKPNPGTCDMFRHQLEGLYRDAGRIEDADRLRSANPDFRDSWQLQQLNRQAAESMKNGLYPQAELIYRRAIEFTQQHPEHIFGLLGGQFDMLGQVLEKEGRDSEAEQAYLRGLEVEENAAGPKPPQSLYIRSLSFAPLMNLYRRKGRLEEMEPIIRHGLEIQEKYLPPQGQGITGTLGILANLYREEKKFAQAKPLYERTLANKEKDLGAYDPALIPTLSSCAEVLRGLHDNAGVAALQARINLLQLIQSRSAVQKPN